jgi:hypothetical protein
MVNSGIGPTPEHPVRLLVQSDQVAPHDCRLSDACGERIGSHAILHSEDTRLELFALRNLRGAVPSIVFAVRTWEPYGPKVDNALPIDCRVDRDSGQLARKPKSAACSLRTLQRKACPAR